MANPFTPEEIAQILEEFFKVVGTRQYIGARYVPLFGRKGETSIQWDNSAPYEPLTIVLYQGDSYTSRQYVPAGVAITDESFWALTGNYNAQIESYRREVQGFSDRIDAVEESNLAQTDQLAGTSPSGLKNLITTNTEHLADVDEQLAGTTNSGLRGLIANNTEKIDTNTENIAAHEQQLAGSSDSGLKTLINANTEKINTNTDNIAAHTQQLAGTTNSGLKELINTNAEAIDAIAERNVLLFGDSWTDTETAFPKWMDTAFKDMHYDNVFNFAKSGAGWVQGIKIETQVANANTELTQAQKNGVRDIIVFALINDIKHLTTYDAFSTQATAVVTAMAGVYTTLAEQYSNARIFFIPTVCGQAYDANPIIAFMEMAIFNKRMACGTFNNWNFPYVAEFFNTYLQWNDNYLYEASGLHLSSNGAITIGSAINKILKGISLSAEMQVTQSVTNSDGSIECNLHFNGDTKLITKFTASQQLSQWARSTFDIPANTAFSKCLVYSYSQRTAFGSGNGIVNTMHAGTGSIYGSQLLSYGNGACTITIGIQNAEGISPNASIYGVL